MKVCNRCSKDLIEGDSWYKWSAKKHDYVCRACFGSRFKSRPKYKQQRKTSTVKKIFDRVLSLKITNMMQGAKKRHIENLLSYEQIGNLMKNSCSYCGYNDSYVGVDRVDSSVGYVAGNVVSCCTKCNFAKNEFSVADFIAHCQKIVKYQEVKNG